jgi:predicted nucleotidyltransferase component of viral defense system
MLEPADLVDVADQFGVSEHQVRRDHLISHVLVALGQLELPVTFFGGTAIFRTFIVNPADGARLSEDIDLYTGERAAVAIALDSGLPRLLRREFPGATMEPGLASVRAVEPASLRTPDGLRVRIQVLDASQGHSEMAQYPTELRPVVLRYRDLPPDLLLRTPTLAAFAAMKTVAWRDRHAARDLYDLAVLAAIDGLSEEVADLVRRVSGVRVAPHDFVERQRLAWHEQLAHQTRLAATPEDCLRVVISAYGRALGWEGID